MCPEKKGSDEEIALWGGRCEKASNLQQQRLRVSFSLFFSLLLQRKAYLFRSSGRGRGWGAPHTHTRCRSPISQEDIIGRALRAACERFGGSSLTRLLSFLCLRDLQQPNCESLRSSSTVACHVCSEKGKATLSPSPREEAKSSGVHKKNEAKSQDQLGLFRGGGPCSQLRSRRITDRHKR